MLIERRRTRAAGWARRLGAFSLVLLLTAGLSRRYGLLEPSDFFLVAKLAAGLALLALACTAFAFARFWNDDDLGGGDLAVGAILAVLTLTPYVLLFVRAAAYPIPSEIATDADRPPSLAVSAGATQDKAQESALASAASAPAGASLAPVGRHYDLPVDQVLDAASAVAGRQGWTLLPQPASDPTEIAIQAETVTPILAFPVHVAVRIADDAGASQVDMRVASPHGAYDLDDIAAMVAAFLSELDAEIARRPDPAGATE